jgi:hypothetical protein
MRSFENSIQNGGDRYTGFGKSARTFPVELNLF